MNSRTRVNGDDTGSHALNMGTAAATTSEPAGTAVAPAVKGKPAPEHQPAFTPPQKNPAVPVDEFHGKGGMYVLVDGKRVPADEAGNPLPAKRK